MNLNEEIRRIKTLMFESDNSYSIQTEGEINSPEGLTICFYSPENKKIGQTKVIGFRHAVDLSRSFQSFMEKQNDDLFNDDCAYSHSLFVDDDFRRQGFGEKLKSETENILKQNNFKYNTAIVSSDNNPSQGLVKKLGYNIYDSLDGEDFFVKEMF